MPGAWEVHQRYSVLCVILHTDVTTTAWSLGLRALQLPGHIICLAGMPYDHARNVGAREALKHNFSHVFYLDSDVIPPADAVMRLLGHEKHVVSGLYCRRSPPVGLPVMIRGGGWVTDYAKNALIEVDMVGAGCLLMSRHILEQLAAAPARPGKPWFDWKVDLAGHVPEGEHLSEDFEMCRRVRTQLGEKVYVDTSIVCRHVGYAQSLPGSFDALFTG